MIGLNSGKVRDVFVETSQDGWLSAEQITALCCRKIIYVGENSSPEVRAQALEFEDRVKAVVFHYVKDAMRAQRDRCVQLALKGGHTELAFILRNS